MARPNWNYIRIDVALPDHEKIDRLSDKAFRTLIELWCWCGYHLNDEFVREAKSKTFGSKTARTASRPRWAEPVNGGYMMHDFVGPNGHQRSRAEAEEKRAQRSEAGKASAAARPNGYDSLNRTATTRSTSRCRWTPETEPIPVSNFECYVFTRFSAGCGNTRIGAFPQVGFNESLHGSFNKTPTEAEAEADITRA